MSKHAPRPLSHVATGDRDIIGPRTVGLYPCPCCRQGVTTAERMCGGCGATLPPARYGREAPDVLPAGSTWLPRYAYRRHKGRWLLAPIRWGTIRQRKGFRAAGRIGPTK